MDGAGTSSRNTFSMGITWAVMGTSWVSRLLRAWAKSSTASSSRPMRSSSSGERASLASSATWRTAMAGRRFSRFFSSVPAATPSLSTSSWAGSTKSGAPVMGQEASFTLGKAITSRMDSAPAMSMHSRSRP